MEKTLFIGPSDPTVIYVTSHLCVVIESLATWFYQHPNGKYRASGPKINCISLSLLSQQRLSSVEIYTGQLKLYVVIIINEPLASGFNSPESTPTTRTKHIWGFFIVNFQWPNLIRTPHRIWSYPYPINLLLNRSQPVAANKIRFHFGCSSPWQSFEF